ncbi:MAG: glycosyltransferase family 4 protein [Myxococcales bacterium]|nr:glycosyltransferase family 4 protein [Myxococcales bacterium]
MLPNLIQYRDRLRMLMRMSARIQRLYVLTAALPPEVSAELAAWPRLRVVPLGRARLRPRAHAWLDAHRARLDVVHDTFGFLADWMGARPAAAGVAYPSSLYTDNGAWLGGIRRRAEMTFDLHYASQRVLTFWRDRRAGAAARPLMVLGDGHGEGYEAWHPGVARGGIRVVPSEVDTDVFHPAASRPAGPPTVLFTGSLLRTKGLGVVLEGMGLVRAGGQPEARLKLLGPVPSRERAWFDLAVARSGLTAPALEAPGRVPHHTLVGHYQTADLYVSMSLFEGSPRSAREALACGCRAILSDIPGHRALDPEGRFIRFVSVDDVAGFAAALGEALAEGGPAAEARSAAGVAHMRDAHSLGAVAERLLREYASARAAPTG